jgi:hypothetical protein
MKSFSRTLAAGEADGRHRFFHTMVVMGGALALGCGGMSNHTDSTGSGGSGSAGSGGSGGKAPSGAGAGGTGTGGTGGAPPPVIIEPVGGAGQGPVQPPVFACSPAELVCSITYPACDGSGFSLPNDCRCDETRPVSPAECDEGESLVCRQAVSDANGTPFTTPVPFDCQCMPNQMYCGLACDMAFPDRGDCVEEQVGENGKTILCNCAVIVLR